MDIGDKESGKRHSSDDNTPKRLDTGRGGREKDKDDTLPEDDEGGREAGNERDEAEGETEVEEKAGDEKTEEEGTRFKVETWFEVGEARFEVVAPGCILAP